MGDFDNDGRPDFFVSCVGKHRLFRNVDGKRFEDMTDAAGVGGSGMPPDVNAEQFLAWKSPIPFGASCTYLDYDRDGRLDLFVCHYVTWSPVVNPLATGAVTDWTPSKDAKLEAKDGVYLLASTGGDPFIVTRDLPAVVGPYTLEFKMKSGSRGTGQIMWTTADDKGYHRDRSATFDPKHDGEWHEYAVKLPVEKALTGLRLDPSTAAGEIRLDAIKLKDKDGKAMRSWPSPPADKK